MKNPTINNRSLARRVALLAVAMLSGVLVTISVVMSLVAEERTLKGSYIGTAVPSRDIPRLIQLYRRGRLPVDRLTSGTLGLDEINLGFDRLHDGTAIRQIVTP